MEPCWPANLELLRDEPAGLRKAAFAWIRQVSGLDLGDEDMEAVEQLQPAERERYFDGKLRLWSSQIRAEARAESLAGERARLRDQAELKFDAPTANRLAESLAGTDAPERLSEAWHWIIVCATSDELLQRISEGENPQG
ncbi:MAG: hypothetical protein OXS50_04240 [Gammaproteobacteria bacterium]|nr:hypothetical protein [Gammaproteobacteria bacterium]